MNAMEIIHYFVSKFFNVLIMSLADVGKMSPGIIPGISG